MDIKEAIAAALSGRPGEVPTSERDPAKTYPTNRLRERVALTIDGEVLNGARESASRLGFSLSAYVEAVLTTGKLSKALRERAAVKSATALDLAPIAQLGSAAAGTVFAIKDAFKAGRPIDQSLLDLLNDIAAACFAILQSGRSDYDHDLDKRMRFKIDDRWSG